MRFIAIDNGTGYIWGDSADLAGRVWSPTGLPTTGPQAELAGAVEYAAALDASLGATDRTYEIVPQRELDANQTGYHVYRADVRGSDAVALVHDGQDEETIDAVERACDYVCTIRCTPVEA